MRIPSILLALTLWLATLASAATGIQWRTYGFSPARQFQIERVIAL